MPDPRAFLAELFAAAVEAVHPARCVPPVLPARPKGRAVVVGFGKGAAAMAAAVEAAWGEVEGFVVTRYGHGADLKSIEMLEAGHPVPDAASEEAAKRMLAIARSLGPDDHLLCLASGGGSSLMTLPAAGLTLADKAAVNRALLKSGAPIAAMNCVRKHLSAIKGGRLALAAAPAAVTTIVISDVPGDDPSVVGSGPTLPDPTTRAEAAAILARYAIDVPPAVTAWLADPASETPKPGDPRLARADVVVAATAQTMLDAAAAFCAARGVRALVLSNAMEGEASMVARFHADLVRQIRAHGQPAPAPVVLLSGGETTVTVRGKGRGGRNSEFLLGLALALEDAEAGGGVGGGPAGGAERPQATGMPGVHALAADTDGIDGSEDNAGAFLDPGTLARARAAGRDPAASLAANDAYPVFEAAGGLLVTGPTRTNVNDLRAVLVEG